MPWYRDLPKDHKMQDARKIYWDSLFYQRDHIG